MSTPMICTPLLLAVTLAALPGSNANAQVAAFHWQADRAPPPGTVWHYTKSNLDGSEPWHLDVYFAAPQRIEVIKWKAGAADFVEVQADLDPARAMPVVLSQWNTASGQRQPTLSARAEGDRTLVVTFPDGNSARIEAARAPLHVWGFDLMGMAMLFPHLKDPAQPFDVHFLDPNRPGEAGPFTLGGATFTPAGEESIDGVPSRKYTLTGPLFGELTGAVWIGKESGRLERAEHGLRTSTDWQDFRLELENAETLDGISWERFKQGLADAQGGNRGPRLAAALKSGYDTGGLAAVQAAETEFRKSVEAGYESELNTFGYALLGLGKTADALAVFTRITRDWPRSVNAWDSLAEAQLEAGDPKAAAASWRQVLELEPGNGRAREQLDALPH